MGVDWPTCSDSGCEGARLPGRDTCLAHHNRHDKDAHRAVSRQPDLRGVTIDGPLLASILEHADLDGEGYSTLPNARFDSAKFVDSADFRDVRFTDRVSFRSAVFAAPVSFRGAHFSGDADFLAARFEEAADFGSTTFQHSDFGRATFGRVAVFNKASFTAASFSDAVFRGPAELDSLSFAARADFLHADFEHAVRLSCEIGEELTLSEARFRGLVDLQVRGVKAILQLRDVLFEGQIDAVSHISELLIERSRFEKGGQFRVSGGDLWLHDTRLGQPMLITAHRAYPSSSPPRLTSARGTDLSGTTIAGFDLSDTRFAGAHGLDGLRIEDRLILNRARGGFRTRRLVIADEEDAERKVRSARAVGPSREEVAGLYRDLRSGREERKDEPGAADFYYGEMEMRRQAAPLFSVDRAVLQAYRLISGYGLRPSRSLATFAGLVLIAAFAFHAGLVHPTPSWPTTILFALRSTVSFVTEPQLTGATVAAQYVQILLRFTGPVLLALTALAIRARIRR